MRLKNIIVEYSSGVNKIILPRGSRIVNVLYDSSGKVSVWYENSGSARDQIHRFWLITSFEDIPIGRYLKLLEGPSNGLYHVYLEY